jgi:mannose-6-phosphate isomerase-like protein (cupin superfamily)
VDVVDLLAVEGRGPAWGTASEDLNATLLVWRAGEGQPAHVNDACDVALLALAGSGSLTVDGEVHELAPGRLAIVPRGTTRALVAGGEGLRCVSVHRRRGGLAIGRAPRDEDVSDGSRTPGT